MTKFDEGWWNCFNSFANNSVTRIDTEMMCFEVLRGAGITDDEANEILLSNDLYGTARDIVVKYLKRQD